MSWQGRLFCFVALCVLFSGCGYRLAANAPIVLPRGVTDLHLDRVADPTTTSWLEPELRSLLRDEFTQRGQVRWVGKDEAQALLQIIIISYSDGSKLKDAAEQTLKSEVRLVLEGRILNRTDRTMLWESGPITTRQSFPTGDESARLQAGHRAAMLAVEQLADALAMKF